MSNDINIGAISEVLNNKMDLDGNNVVASAGASFRNTSNWSNNMTNCITSIPQDINLELNNGTLTLKAGSKVYIPHGSGVFNAATSTTDVSITRTDSQECIVWRTPSGGLNIFPKILFYSGATAPTQYQYMFWYDTTENKCKVTSDSGSTWAAGASFPICLVETDGTKISAIKQVFNGFGYIGSTVFVLPGVKGLIPNGRNKDGTLKNIETTVLTVRTISGGGSDQKNIYAIVLPGGALSLNGEFKYDEKNNITYNGVDIQPQFLIAHFDNSGGKITNFTLPKTVFHAVDYSDFKPVQDHSVIEFQAPTSANNYTWYRKYADGWVEQGGCVVITSAAVSSGAYNTANITFPIALQQTRVWKCQAKHDRFNAGFSNDTVTTGAQVYQVNDSGASFTNPFVIWEVKGMAA